MKWLAVLLVLVCGSAQAQTPIVGPLQAQNLLSEIAAQGSAAQTQACVNLGCSSGAVAPPTNAVQFNSGTGLGGDSTFTFNSSTKLLTGQALTLTGPGTGLTVNHGATIGTTGSTTNLNGSINLFNTGTITLVNSPSCITASYLLCGVTKFTGTVSGINSMSSLTWQDSVLAGTSNVDGLFIGLNQAPNGSTSSGPRVTLDLALDQVGSLQGGTITGASNSDVLRETGIMSSNLGGTPTTHFGTMTTENPVCTEAATASDVNGCNVVEYDLNTNTGATFQRNQFASFIILFDQVEGNLGPTRGLGFAKSTGGGGYQGGLWDVLEIGSTAAAWPMNPWGVIIRGVQKATATTPTGGGTDLSRMAFTGFSDRRPFAETVPLQAVGITTATRLTSDGQVANGFILDSPVQVAGSAYTSEPAAAVTGCTGAALNTALGAGGVVGEVGVFAPGTACEAEATVAITGGGGSGATARLIIAGNALNLPTNSTNIINCNVAVSDTGPGNVAYTITFVATMGATSSTTAIVGSPSWTPIGTDGAIAIAAPTADTTLGAVNITVTPSGVTANVGGSCDIHSTQQVM